MQHDEPAPPSSRLYPPYPLLAASIAVFRHGKVLLASRTKPPFAGVFSLPGGLVEVGETMQEAALRELREEVAVEARIAGFNRHIETIDQDTSGRIRHHYVIASFVGIWVAGDGAPGPEAGAVVWADTEMLGRLTCTPNIVSVIEAARRKLEESLPEAPDQSHG